MVHKDSLGLVYCLFMEHHKIVLCSASRYLSIFGFLSSRFHRFKPTSVLCPVIFLFEVLE